MAGITPLYPFTVALLSALKRNQIEPNIEPHDEADGLDGADLVWLVQETGDGSWLGEYLSIQSAHLESDDWIVSHSSRHAFGGDPEHWSQIGTTEELMPTVVDFFTKRFSQFNE